MKRATITIPDELEARVEEFLAAQTPEPSLTALVQAALTRYLDEIAWTRRAFVPPAGRLRITPADRGSGATDTAERHDAVLAAAARKPVAGRPGAKQP